MEQIPKGTRFEVAEDIDTDGLVHWHAAFTSGFHCVIPKGTILVTFRDCSASSAAFGLVPEDYKGFEQKYVPHDDSVAQKYAGYSFVFALSEVGRKLRLSNIHS
jgi:hypothetical protein